MIECETTWSFAYREPFLVEIVLGLERRAVNMKIAAIDGQGAVDEGDDECSPKHLAAFRKDALQTDSFSMSRQRRSPMSGHPH